MGVFGAVFGCRGDAGFNGRCLGASIGDGGFTLACISGRRGVIGCIVATWLCPEREKVRPGSSPVEWCNRFVSFGVGYALSWSGGSSCWVGWGVSRDLVRMSRLR